MNNKPDKAPMNEIRSLADGKWFSPGNIRFFSTTLAPHGYYALSGKAIYFASGERFTSPWGDDPRRYSVRRLDMDTRYVDTVGGFQEFDTMHAATMEARRLAQEDV